MTKESHYPRQTGLRSFRLPAHSGLLWTWRFSVGELQSWSGAVTHRDTNRLLDKYTANPRTQSLLSLTGSKQSLSLCSLSCSPSLSLVHTHTTTVYQKWRAHSQRGVQKWMWRSWRWWLCSWCLCCVLPVLVSTALLPLISFYILLLRSCLPLACPGSCSWSVTRHG